MRSAAVADHFYPGSPEALTHTLTKLFSPFVNIKKSKAIAVLAPHAGYIYSGPLAAKTLMAVEIPETVIILGPTHHGQSVAASLSTKTWEMALGNVPIDTEIANLLMKSSHLIKIDEGAHRFEHCLEVQVPFLQMLQNNLSIVPLLLSALSFTQCEEVAAALTNSIKNCNKEVLIVASSDMNHYETRQICEQKDNSALQCIKDLAPYRLYRTVIDNRISMCGFIPMVISLLVAKSCGAKQANVVGHTDSGYVSGDTTQVVGYAGAIIS